MSLVKNILFGIEMDASFDSFRPVFYGIGFQIFSQPIHFFLSDIFSKFQDVDSNGAHLL